jgi:leucyl/phenylalanyl-tRNA--protein transferase
MGVVAGLPALLSHRRLIVDASCPDVVAVGGDLSVPTLLAAYRDGVFPWPAINRDDVAALRRRYRRAARAGLIEDRGPPGWSLPWFSPDPRAVLLPTQIHVSRSLRRRLRRSDWTTTCDLDFPAVVAGCRDRPAAWITAGLAAAYEALHAAGLAHSIEVWTPGGELIGGLYGVLVGGVFCGESMFHRVGDASKVALLDLADRFARAGGSLIDCQTPTTHLLAMGQLLVTRASFLDVLVALRDRPVRLITDRLPVERLMAPLLGAVQTSS